jgi:hypothetical protein
MAAGARLGREKFPFLVANFHERYPHATIIILDGAAGRHDLSEQPRHDSEGIFDPVPDSSPASAQEAIIELCMSQLAGRSSLGASDRSTQ